MQFAVEYVPMPSPDIKTVIINGKIIMEDRTLVTINEKEAIENVIRISTKIKASLGIEDL